MSQCMRANNSLLLLLLALKTERVCLARQHGSQILLEFQDKLKPTKFEKRGKMLLEFQDKLKPTKFEKRGKMLLDGCPRRLCHKLESAETTCAATFLRSPLK
ncbi:hypothetical protein RND81_11G068300 [Saponaria officinalis]|uniref:Secreted protein n=1 Tax=Saponaria officinalis TaxID=3572 RepID=A0AAW1HJ79_SAPOF